ncbi:GNAT family N-acetyltransferase [Ruegeria sp. HKCCE3926]|uniref:GNAT family N-acetyltransferase n=1 Tax=Ruegeria sp. HKCCE3926 TaxID=2794831 RepID=UPI001AE56723
MIQEASPSDAPAIEAFLAKHPDTSMFLRSNLLAHGIGFGDDDHSTRFFIWGQDRIQGVFGLTKKGYLMAQLPDCSPEAAQAFAGRIAGQTVLGMTGAAQQVEMILDALGLGQAGYRLHHDEPLYRLDLGEIPEAPIPFRALSEADRPLLTRWFADYFEDTDQAKGQEAREMASDRITTDIQSGRAIVMLEDDAPVAMAAINASVRDQVQVGGVFVPRENRNCGLGRKVTTAVLQKARTEGANKAILFANNPPAARAYEAMGFQQIGWYRIALLQTPQKVLS